MSSYQNLKIILKRIHGKGYKAYKEIKGNYLFPDFILFIDHVQADPFASPSKIRIRVSQKKALFPKNTYTPKIRAIALADYLTRKFHDEASKSCSKKGTGKSGLILIDKCGQEVLERSSCKITSEYVEVRFYIGLPAKGRTILGQEAEYIFYNLLPKLVQKTLLYPNLNSKDLQAHITCIEDQSWLRSQLSKNNLVAFIANGAILPRESGISDKPLPTAIPFMSPPSLEVEFNLPNKGKIKGMGIKKGITLIVGGGFHGKSTLLKALEKGVYNHIPGDGREFVITTESAVKIRAEDGRSIIKTDISPFISNLPFNQDTTNFSTQNASGSTSQAANIIEAIESKTFLLLLDEDTCATNFMLRDTRMQELVDKKFEPITPFLDRIQELYKNFSISTILVLGGCGDYFDVADTVIMLRNYQVVDVTLKAKKVAKQIPLQRKSEKIVPFTTIRPKIPQKNCLQEFKKEKVKVKDIYTILINREKLDLTALEQLVAKEQTNAISYILKKLAHQISSNQSLISQIEKILEKINKEGLDILNLGNQHPGSLALPRKQEIFAALNRYRNLKIK